MKLDKMIKFVPDIYNAGSNQYARGLLTSWSNEDDLIVEQIQNAKEQIFVKTARLQYLDALGSNVGVFRPTEFNLSDSAFSGLIPLLSYFPKQVVPTIRKILEIFFGENNPRVAIHEINPNEIIIEIPSSVPALRRDLRGSHHFKSYSASVVSIDNVTKEMVVDFDAEKSVQVDELAFAFMGQGFNQEVVLSNTAGTTGVILQFPASADLSVFTTTEKINHVLTNYPGSFIPDTTTGFTVTKDRGTLGQTITAGTIIPTMTMLDASNIPNANGELVFNFGRNNEEGPVEYFGRPNNSTLLISPTYIFQNDHEIGEIVNVSFSPYQEPAIDGSDYSVYLVGITAARVLAQEIVESVTAAGIVIRWIINEPIC